MRITGGVLGGRRLRVPSGPVRPTQDRVREALFSSLAAFIPGARVLDLFAGSGAVGLEALSRGAAFVCWVESNRRVFAVLRENIRLLAGDASTRMGSKAGAGDPPPGVDPALTGVVLREALDFLSAAPPEAPFDLVFADPPYDRENRFRWTECLFPRLALESWLKPGGFFVMEQASNSPVAEAAGWGLIKNTAYGESRLCIYRKTI